MANPKVCAGCGHALPGAHFNSHWCPKCKKRAEWDNKLRWIYGIGANEYDAILAAQGGVCAICGRKPGKSRLAVDHDHRCCPKRRSCGKCIRGLLCKACNYYLLGQICQENKRGSEHAIMVLRQAINYLEGHNAGRGEAVDSVGARPLRGGRKQAA